MVRNKGEQPVNNKWVEFKNTLKTNDPILIEKAVANLNDKDDIPERDLMEDIVSLTNPTNYHLILDVVSHSSINGLLLLEAVTRKETVYYIQMGPVNTEEKEITDRIVKLFECEELITNDDFTQMIVDDITAKNGLQQCFHVIYKLIKTSPATIKKFEESLLDQCNYWEHDRFFRRRFDQSDCATLVFLGDHGMNLTKFIKFISDDTKDFLRYYL